jgi:hypothetical protein
MVALTSNILYDAFVDVEQTDFLMTCFSNEMAAPICTTMCHPSIKEKNHYFVFTSSLVVEKIVNAKAKF